MRVAMLKKTSADAKKRVVFFIVCSSIFRENLSKNHAKRVKTIHVHKNQQKITCRTLFMSKNRFFCEFWGSPRVPRGLPGRPGKFPKSLVFLIHGQLRLKTMGDGLWEASGKPRRSPPGPPGEPCCVDFWIDFARQKQTKTCKKC